MRRFQRVLFAGLVLMLSASAVYAQRSPAWCHADTAIFHLLPNYPPPPNDRTPIGPDSVHSLCNVDQPAKIDPSPAPEYPQMLASGNLDGDVTLQFMVLANGSIDTKSMHVLRSTHDLFTTAVRRAFVSWHAKPARYRGRAVKQLVEYEVLFRTQCPEGPRPLESDARATGSVLICPAR